LMLKEGSAVFAGTINPHLPRRLISPSCINSWLGEQTGESRPMPR
jgi:hypothetical protein